MRGATWVIALFVSACRTASPDAPSEPRAPEPTASATPEAEPSAKPADPFVPISKVRANAIYAPNPTQAELAATKSGIAKKPVSTTVSFCVEKNGVPADVETAVSSGDANLDLVCRDTVTHWRFKPFMVDGVAVKTCSSVEFKIAFQ